MKNPVHNSLAGFQRVGNRPLNIILGVLLVGAN